MGATTFEMVGWGKDPKDAFERAQELAREEFGTHGYTGTIAEKRTFKFFRETFRTEKKAQEFMDYHIDQPTGIGDRDAPAGCFELTGAQAKEWRERLGLKGKKGIRLFVFFGWART